MKKLWFLALLFAAGCSSPSGTNNSNSSNSVFGIWKTPAYYASLNLINDDSATVTMTITGTHPPQPSQTHTYPVSFSQPFNDSVYAAAPLPSQDYGPTHELWFSWDAPSSLDAGSYGTFYIYLYHVNDSLVGLMTGPNTDYGCVFTR